MHEIIKSGIEDYLGGNASREFHIHLAQCPECRKAVDGMQAVSNLFSPLRANALAEPVHAPLGFSTRVLQSVREQNGRGIWSLFTVDASFTRRLAFACLLTLAVFGGYFATSSDSAPEENTPEAVMAHHDSGQDSDKPTGANMLLTLASYSN